MTLKELAVGNSGVVAKINTEGPLKQRLLDMGITKGTKLTVLKIAPLGDPIEVEIRGYNLSVRKADAETIDMTDVEVVELPKEEEASSNKFTAWWNKTFKSKKNDKEVK